VLFVVVYVTQINTTLIQSEDMVPSLYLPLAIIQDNSFYLDNYYQEMYENYPQPDGAEVPFYLRKIDGHFVTAFPIITPILALPFFLIFLTPFVTTSLVSIAIVAKISAMVFVALAVGVMYKNFNLLGISHKFSVLLSLVFAFATNAFALSSQGLWQHGASHLLVALFFYFVISELITHSSINLMLSSFIASLIVLNRPPDIIIVLPLLVFLLFNKGRVIKKILWLGMFGLAPIILFFIYNNYYFGSIMNQGYGDQLLTSWSAMFPESFLGLLFSPSKGLLIYSPIFLFSFIGGFLALKKKQAFYVLLLGLSIIYMIVMSKWRHWYGGYSFGYRMITDLVPVFMLLLVPFIKSDLYQKSKRYFFGAIIWSVLIQIMGVIYFDGIWHTLYDNGPKDYSWLWSVKDSEVIFNIKRSLLKVGVISNDSFLR